ncbi:MAG: formate/nitrite transporter family protein, partial [Firmicutes bacterium]|nr:formate/nitrite transporter family protein [Bacillota bacterium]
MHISKFVTPESSTEKKEKQYLDLSSVELNIGTGTVLAVEPIICNSPADIAKSCAGAAEKKAAITLTPLRVLAILAGAYIAMGGILNTVITNDLGNY